MKKKSTALPTMPRFLMVPYADKDNAKALGMKWHPHARLWYIPKGKQRAGFPYPDAALTKAQWREVLAKEEAARQQLLKQQRHAFIKADAERNKSTRQILAEGAQRLHAALAEA